MGSAFLPRLCLLLLALPALGPGIAVSGADLAEGSNGSSCGKTTVTVYHCENCGNEGCVLSDYEGFKIVGKTENETFSNEHIQLVIGETHITMCFQQETIHPKAVYAIVWEKPCGIGESCGIPHLEASLENRRQSTTDGKICCEAETNLSEPDSALRCYTETTGDLLHSDNKNSRAGIAAVFLTLGVCAAAVLSLYCCWRARKRQGPVIVLQQAYPASEITTQVPETANLTTV